MKSITVELYFIFEYLIMKSKKIDNPVLKKKFQNIIWNLITYSYVFVSTDFKNAIRSITFTVFVSFFWVNREYKCHKGMLFLIRLKYCFKASFWRVKKSPQVMVLVSGVPILKLAISPGTSLENTRSPTGEKIRIKIMYP